MTKQKVKRTDYVSISNALALPEIIISGYLGDGPEQIDYSCFQHALQEVANNYPECNIRLMCYGGSVYDGMAMYDLMKATPGLKKHCIVNLAASMGAVLAMACDDVAIAEHGRFMTHKVQGGGYGEAENLREIADDIEKLEGQIIDIFIQRTGKDAATVNSWFVPNKYTWHDAAQAVANGLADRIIQDEDQAEPVPTNALDNPEQAWQFYANAYQVHSNPTDINMKKQLVVLLVAAGYTNALLETDSDAVFENAVKDVIGKKDLRITELENALKVRDQARVDALITNALEQGKIMKADEKRWREMAEQSFESAEFALSKMTGKPGDINNILRENKAAATGAAADPNDSSSWTYDQWQKKNPKGLMAMKRDEPERFTKLFNAAFPEA